MEVSHTGTNFADKQQSLSWYSSLADPCHSFVCVCVCVCVCACARARAFVCVCVCNNDSTNPTTPRYC
jgi:hypothetical protein